MKNRGAIEGECGRAVRAPTIKKREEMKKIIIRTLVVLIALFIGLILFLRFWNFDIPEQDFSDMLPTRRNIPKESNGFYVYRQAYAKITDVEKLEELYKNHESSKEEIEAFLAENKEALALIDKALTMDFEEPDIKLLSDQMPYVREWDSLLSILILKQNPQMSFLFLNHLSSHTDETVSFLVLHNLLKKYLTDQVFILTQDEAKKLTQNFKKSFKEGLQGNFSIYHDILKSLSSGKTSYQEVFNKKDRYDYELIKIALFLQVNRTSKISYDYHKEMMASADKNFMESSFNLKFYSGYIHQLGYKELYNYFGRDILKKVFINPRFLVIKYFETLSYIKLRACVGALRLYQKDQGKPPESLNVLVPKYLAEIPVDPFDGEPLRYDAKRGVIYSVGRNRVDDGGQIEAGKAFYEDRDGDIVFQFLK